ncbi:bifunctional 23S rRNA (guanine(2069)-N(7))-methyltransferase RlmK/23S rRNA (guanine(2445)-N(2))-methyltransferase RlmL [Microbulbifer flavimaris]|uniref:Ribosomal RNA large subunit methyltransferase K/L n=1 Tax=Microbulbifer flavimaris TaxID=1781068 RepID=A0ABX4I4L8_9GAMM|nr:MULTISPECIES: bifunctional 23S rRNA (guanine(2069)-N(7))-methyltransferase RlmK/23S rRNA (guanine(2445)-N(2))-methyltransferase RlmL [Microbulbifer]KUJ84899.1 50S rRNA methyltransferase [Microbulbifer sp. ZGT114]PCO06998.1 bifunctional 23S rRNA (guanine(2069)-N(7))-methyltransferase RlmK/23S rRNA (guanine(2445)-N(2))-methyltransferase RlmL [Microbulbifer flavimaris]
MTETQHLDFTATCPKGLESLLAKELNELGASVTREQPAAIHFSGTLEVAYRACLWSRLANRILLQLSREKIADAEDLYRAVAAQPWEAHINPNGKLWVQFSGTNREIRNSQFGAQKAKDAIVDRLRQQSGSRPLVERDNPDLAVVLRLHRDHLDISIDLSGESLHRRGYRTHIGAAPLKENLAAALLLRCGWPEIAARGGALLDPMCGSGTILIEGAMMAADCAPGLLRESFGFERWLNHQSDIWLGLREEALARRAAGLERELPEIRGYDADAKVLFAAEANISRAGLERQVRVSCRPVAAFKIPSHRPVKTGLVLTNPPYGERLGEQEALRDTYAELGRQLKQEFPGWLVGIFTGNPELGFSTGLRSHKQYQLYNGSIPSQLLLFQVREQVGEASAKESRPLSEEAQMVANRLRKNMRTTGKWARKNGIDCYRLYDADLPEYAAAVDIYRSLEGAVYAHLQEYRPPAKIEEDKARGRLRDLVRAVREVLEIPQGNISIKERRRLSHKGGGSKPSQYQKQGGAQGERSFWVNEYGAELEVDLWTYLDSGIFLDHRPVRQYVRRLADGKKFLNLFCYTGTATVQAALGGASQSTSVDMSKTYQAWAARNFRRNQLDPYRHQLVEADCLQWLASAQQNRRGHYDLIFLDPPSFSNSAKMRGVLDVQRDHADLIRQCMALLAPGGILVFSNNLRSFKMDGEVLEEYSVQNLSAELLDRDFQRNPKIHNVWRIEARS